ncbi:MAG: phage protein GemA/Gp16 family protein [bacterium]
MDRKKLALIHIIKRELNLSEREYRDILFHAAGVQSAKELSEAKFRKLVNYFVRSKHYRINHHGLTIKQKYYIRFLAQELSWDDTHLKNFIHKYYKKNDINTLTKKEAIKLIESLKNVKHHQE